MMKTISVAYKLKALHRVARNDCGRRCLRRRLSVRTNAHWRRLHCQRGCGKMRRHGLEFVCGGGKLRDFGDAFGRGGFGQVLFFRLHFAAMRGGFRVHCALFPVADSCGGRGDDPALYIRLRPERGARGDDSGDGKHHYGDGMRLRLGDASPGGVHSDGKRLARF